MFIPSYGIGEIQLDLQDMHWYMLNSSFFEIEKEIPFFRLLFEMASLRMRYYHGINANRSFLLQTILDLGNVTTWFILGFKKLKSLSNKIFLTSDIET